MLADRPSRHAQTAPNISAVDISLRSHQYDVVIVGGGIVGLTLACGLRDTHLRVAVIESQTAQQAASRPRAYAFSPVSAKILDGLGLWDEVGPQLTPFQQVQLSDADYPKALTFRPEDGRGDAVYYSAEHTVLMKALQTAIGSAPTIDYWCESRVVPASQTTASQTTVGQMLTVEHQGDRIIFETQLIVGADGARSGVRDLAGIQTFGWKYWQSCITAVLEPEQTHANTAYERFWPSGPFAILPLPHNRCQIVWTAPHQEAKDMLALPKDQFLRELSARYGSQMGPLKLVNQPMMFPVQLMQSKHYVRPGVALIGDAAHCCHPVGGQGLNMGIRDAIALAEVLRQAQASGDPLGSLTVLKRYERWRRPENWFTLSLTDFLNRAFSNRFWPLVIARRTGIWVISSIKPLRRLILQLMTGFFGKLPASARGKHERQAGRGTGSVSNE
ncbi:MAG: FAD-dependent hydroxylase [Phormidesmis sp.]